MSDTRNGFRRIVIPHDVDYVLQEGVVVRQTSGHSVEIQIARVEEWQKL